MSKEEFMVVMGFLENGIGKPIAKGTADVYFDLLGDLPAAALLVAVKMTLLENPYPTIPPISQLRAAALRATDGEVPTAIEAWRLAVAAVRRFGLRGEDRGLASLPAGVARAVACFGWQSLCDSTEPEICRAQFTKAYESLALTERRAGLMPPSVKNLLQSIGKPELFLEGAKQ